MKFIYKPNIPKGLPVELINSAVSLEHVGVNAVAWNYKNAVQVAFYLRTSGYVILGGDVYKMEHEKLIATCNDWYINKNDVGSNCNLIEESAKRTIEYIENFHKKFGEIYYYSFVYKR
jgi:hypothetical protein